MNANIFLILTTTAKNILRPLMDDCSYDGPHLEAVKIFRKMAHFQIVERMWKKPTIGGKKRFLYSITVPRNAKDAIDYLLEEYPNQIAVAGAWFWDGRQVGTQFVLDEDGSKTYNLDENGEPIDQPITTGTSTYPIGRNALLKFMPDIIERDSEGAIISTNPATELTDVNLEQGMQPRIFD